MQRLPLPATNDPNDPSDHLAFAGDTPDQRDIASLASERAGMTQEDLVDLDQLAWSPERCRTIISGDMQPNTVADPRCSGTGIGVRFRS